MKTKNYQIPLCEEILLAGESVICASVLLLLTDSSQGLEGWTTDLEGSWD